MAKRKASLKDIASLANVSIAAVSYVLNSQENKVAPENAKKIKAIARKLNYRPNHLARSLKTQKTHTIGLVVANISYRFTTGITSAIEAQAKKNRYTVIFGSSDEHVEKFDDLLNVFINRQVDGLILVPVENSEKEINFLKEQGLPFVLIDRYFPGISTNYIAVDNYNTAFHAVSYLVDMGNKRIAFINYKSKQFHLKERTRGYLEALKKHNITGKRLLYREIRQEHMDKELGPAIDDLLKHSKEKLAIFFATDTLAINGMKHLTRSKLKVPDDVHVLSFDEAEAFELYPHAITHCRQPLEAMGKIAVETLLSIMEDKKITTQILLPADFVAGESCGEI